MTYPNEAEILLERAEQLIKELVAERSKSGNAGLSCEHPEAGVDRFLTDVTWCSKCGAVVLDGGHWRLPERR